MRSPDKCKWNCATSETDFSQSTKNGENKNCDKITGNVIWPIFWAAVAAEFSFKLLIAHVQTNSIRITLYDKFSAKISPIPTKTNAENITDRVILSIFFQPRLHEHRISNSLIALVSILADVHACETEESERNFQLIKQLRVRNVPRQMSRITWAGRD